ALCNYHKAIKYYTKAIKLNKNHSPLYNNRANSYADIGDYDNALKDLTSAIRISPKLSLLYGNRCQFSTNQKDYANALKDCNYAIKLKPKGIYTHYKKRSSLYLEMKEYDKALKDIDKAIYQFRHHGPILKNIKKRDENDSYKQEKTSKIKHLYTQRAKINVEKKEYLEALKDLNIAFKLDPNYSFAYYLRGKICSLTGKEDFALKNYNAAIKTYPTGASHSYAARGLHYYKIGKYSSAIKDYNKALKIMSIPETYYHRALYYLRMKKYKSALSDLNKAINEKPLFPEAYFARGKAYEKLNDIEFAKYDYQTACEGGLKKACSK
ncbi:MAG: tetratricopeptide repeat protein, partial [Elusimicrobiales bacterium]|nr:tetratricopeptide repeat protein [Elusimicrobiales bacterium]